MMSSSFIRVATLAAWIVGSIGGARHVAAQRAPEKPPAFATKVWQSDSLDISFPTLSPDGRWIVFANSAFGRSNLWVIPANGGDPIALTTGAHVDAFPAWFPSGDKIAFVSNRTGGVMVLGFDRQTGHAAGSPRRVTLDKADRFAISNAGDRIAYFAESPGNHLTVRVIPATGGTAVTIGEASTESIPLVPSFSADDRYVLFASTGVDRGSVSIVRIPVSGGPTEVVMGSLRGNLWAMPVPGRQEVLQINGPQRGALIAFTGDTITTLDLGSSHRIVPARDGRSAFTTSDRVVAPVRMVRLTGETRNISAGNGYDWPYGWSADGKRVIYSLGDALPTTWTIEMADVDGRNRRPVNVRPTNLAISPTARPRDISFTSDLRYAAFKVDSMNAPRAFSLVVVDLQTGIGRQITSRLDRKTVLTGNGDWYATNHGEFVYTERNGDRLELRAAKPTGETRLLRSLTGAVRGLTVEGDEIAYTQSDGDSTTLFVAHGPSGDAKTIARWLGRMDEVVWSPDAKSIAATITGRDPVKKTASELAIIPVNAAEQTRFIATGDGGYGAVWTRDGTAVFYLKADKGWTQMSVWRYPMRSGEPAENVTKNETSMIWGYVLSPDGSAVLIPPERNRGTTLWRVDLQKATAAYREAKARKN